ncbi:TIGR03571 family LLM class oxidoreductase [Allostreptomyces psammosilenae]|uniref:Luciferase-type oxidoreductase n=1 Tax=Allostreptomyces psammosilenae TaxID=1892865 RepID=A0A852ZWY4_9ACTN|nr:TIGR03571 family LLM class oxidoreductase [Allostreptomyces psammosilenae]NYI06876.1 luciferase-type oxidoreductase [Allostreptomyces psammosilenae]
MSAQHPALSRLIADGHPTIGVQLPLDNDWSGARRRRTQELGLPSGVPDLSLHTERARLVDQLGFASIWLRDVPLYDPQRFGDAGTVLEAFTHLGHLAAVTENAVLGTAAIVLPLRQPLLVAKAAATVDHLTGGRFVLGVASGDRPVEYPLFGRDYESRGDRMRDFVEMVRRAWAVPEPGEGIELPVAGLTADLGLDVLPKPPGGELPMVVAGRARQSMDWIATHADGWLTYGHDNEAVALLTRQWRRLTADADRYKPFIMPMHLDLTEDPDTPATPIREGWRTGRKGLAAQLDRLGGFGVDHVTVNLRQSERPVEEVLQELAETILPAYPAPSAEAAPAGVPGAADGWAKG